MRDVGGLDYGGSSGGLYSRREVDEYVQNMFVGLSLQDSPNEAGMK